MASGHVVAAAASGAASAINFFLRSKGYDAGQCAAESPGSSSHTQSGGLGVVLGEDRSIQVGERGVHVELASARRGAATCRFWGAGGRGRHPEPWEQHEDGRGEQEHGGVIEEGGTQPTYSG